MSDYGDIQASFFFLIKFWHIYHFIRSPSTGWRTGKL